VATAYYLCVLPMRGNFTPVRVCPCIFER